MSGIGNITATGWQPKVCLLFPRFYEGFIMRKVPLGLAYIASALQKEGIYVEAYNLNVDELENIDLAKFNVIGITCLTPFLSEINLINRHIKSANPNAIIVIGGAHPTFHTVEVFDEIPEISFAVTGEGEESLPKLVLNLQNYREVCGVYYRDEDGKVKGTPHKLLNIDVLPYPDQRLFNHGKLESRNPFRAIIGSRGCPFKCFNCQPILNAIQPFRLRKPEDVFQEIKFFYETYNQTYFGFLDSEFPMNKRWFSKFHSLVKKSRIPFEFHCNARSDLLDEDILTMYKDLNISRLAIGIESGVPRIVREVLHKDIDLDYTWCMFAHARSIEIPTHGHFMIGIPGESLADMHQTLAYAMSLPAKSIEFNILTPWPGTAFYNICKARKYLTETDTGKFNEKRRSYITTEEFTADQVLDFYEYIRSTLVGDGWMNSDDGSVYFSRNW